MVSLEHLLPTGAPVGKETPPCTMSSQSHVWPVTDTPGDCMPSGVAFPPPRPSLPPYHARQLAPAGSSNTCLAWGTSPGLGSGSCSTYSLSAQGHSDPAGRGRHQLRQGPWAGLRACPTGASRCPEQCWAPRFILLQPVACRLRTPPNWVSGFAPDPSLLPARRAPGPGWLRTQVAT